LFRVSKQNMTTGFKLSGVFIRFFVALVLVMSTYNPSGASFYHWIIHRGDTSIPLIVLTGIGILIGWVVFFRATFRSLGALGILLATALFGCLVWLAIDFKVLTIDSPVFIYILLVILAAVLAIGMSWSHIRRRLSGQADMDDVDQ